MYIWIEGSVGVKYLADSTLASESLENGNILDDPAIQTVHIIEG